MASNGHVRLPVSLVSADRRSSSPTSSRKPPRHPEAKRRISRTGAGHREIPRRSQARSLGMTFGVETRFTRDDSRGGGSRTFNEERFVIAAIEPPPPTIARDDRKG